MKTAHFFAGGGGGILASEILGHESVLAIEINERRCEILRERQLEGWFPGMEIICADIREFDSKPWAGRVDCVSAGFPCQDISCIGKGAGINGKKSKLFFDLLNRIDEIKPPIIFLENSPRIIQKGRDIIIKNLVARGYSWRDGNLAASHVGAGHKRDRWWCLAANAVGKRLFKQYSASVCWHKNARQDSSKLLARIQPSRLANQCGEFDTPWSIDRIICEAGNHTSCKEWNPYTSDICGVVDGMADRVDRIKTCGDGQVPLQAAVAWMCLVGHK